MKNYILIAGMLSAAFAVQADILFSDSFDRADSADVNLNSAASQSGTVAPLSYGVFSNNTATSAVISNSKALVNVDGSGEVRLVPQYDFSDQSAAIVSAGGFEVSYTVSSGIDYAGTIHGTYASSLILSQKSIVENAAAGSGNPWHGLFVKIQGNGQVGVYSQGATLLSAINGDYSNSWLTGQENDVRVVVESDGFATTDANSFSLYINDVLVGSNSFNWKSSNDLSIGLEAGNYSAQFDTLQVQTVPEPATAGLLGMCGMILAVIRRWMMR